MCKNRCHFIRVVVLGAVCAGLLRAAAEDAYTYQSLTNLGPRTSSRVLLMNNDTNPICPIEGQGYHDTSNTVAVGQTYWWHDDTPLDEMLGTTPVSDILNLQTGIHHILYQKREDGQPPLKLWELINCRAGSSAVKLNTNFNYLPWSSTCQPIDPDFYVVPPKIPDEWTRGAYSNGMRQVAVVTMRASTEAAIYSPLYKEGIGAIYFDTVNFMNAYVNSHIAVEVATSLTPVAQGGVDDAFDFGSETDMSRLAWERLPCEVFMVKKDGTVIPDADNDNVTEVRLHSTAGHDNMYFRIKVSVDYRGPARFRIIRTDVWATRYMDYQDIIAVDNIIVSYPTPRAILSPTGIDADGASWAQVGRVGAFTEPLLSKGLSSAKPRMNLLAETNGLPSFIPWKVEAADAEFVYRWHYLNQVYGSWATNKMSLAENGKELVGDEQISITNEVGDLEYYYIADVAGTHYKFYDFANDTPVYIPEADVASVHVRYPNTDADPASSNYWSRIREGVSPWQEMHLIAEVCTNAEDVVVVTNDWTMELISDHTWRGFVWTPPQYSNNIAHIKFVGRNFWETNAVRPILDSRTWYFPPAASENASIDIPMGSVAVTNIDGLVGWDAESKERDVTLDCSAGYLIFEFNDESGAFTMNRAEYQDFNKWTPDAGQPEDAYIGNYVNTSYVGRAKQEFSLELPKLAMSRSSSSYWWENFDAMAGNDEYPFDDPFEEHITPNGWKAKKGMFINGMFSAATNKETYGMALQLEGRGNGSISLIDSADVPQGVGTVSFSARLAQYYEMSDFCYYVDGTGNKDYAISAKAAMTNHRQAYSDVSTGSPALSLVTYYRPGKGCYEFRVTRVYATYGNLWDANGVMEIAIYKWYRSSGGWETKKLKSLRLGGSSTTYNPQLAIGRYYTNGTTKPQFQNYFVPPTSGTTVTNNADWTTIYFGAYNTASGTFLEGGVGGTYTASKDPRTDISNASGIMMSVSVTDTDEPFQKGSYGVSTRECPGVFGNIQTHALGGVGPYKGKTTTVFGSSVSEATHIAAGDWESTAGRIISWLERKNIDYMDYTGTYNFGLCAAPLEQRLYLKLSPAGDAENWKDSGLDLRLSSYLPTNVVFAPHTVTPANVQIRVGGTSGDLRTDVAVDDIELSQWAGNSSSSSAIGSMTEWAYTDAWIAGTTNEFYQSTDSIDDADEVAVISKCSYYSYKVPGTDNDFIYVFTNTTRGAYGSYATFTPKVDVTIKELFVMGAGGGGGPGGGGGGGGESLWITNSVDYTAGEKGIRIYVGNGGGGGTERYSNNDVRPGTAPGSGGTSYVYMKNPFNATDIQQYRGYGGYRGGWFYRDNNSYSAGGGSNNGGGAGGGSALISSGHNPGSTIMNNDLHTYGREIYGAGYGGAAVNGASGGGGGGGLRGLGDSGSNYAAGNATNPRSVIYAGQDGEDGTGEATGGKGGDGFPISVMGNSYIRTAIAELLNPDNPDMDAWLGGGGGGGSGINTTAASITAFGVGAYGPGVGGQGGGGQGGLYTAGSYNINYQQAMGKNAVQFSGGGGGGGSFNNPVRSGNNANSNWIIGGGKGSDGIVVMHVQVKDRFVMLQPMRGEEEDPMSVRTLFLNGISLLSFSWKWADSNAVLHVQVATNGMNSANPPIRARTTSLYEGWTDVCDPIKFKDMSAALREKGSTNVLIGLRAPICGLVRVLADPDVVVEARKGSTNNLYSMYGTVLITGMKVLDEPELDDRSWWGWNIMPTYRLEWSSLYDPVTLGPGRSCGLNFSGVAGTGVDDPLFADDPTTHEYSKHDPFIQTPRFTNNIGAVSFKARVLETNLNKSGWVTISAWKDPGEEKDEKWDVLTNIEITAGTTIFRPYMWRIPASKSHYQALRLTAWGAAEGRNHSEETNVGDGHAVQPQPFGTHGTANPTPIQRVLIDEVAVTQPMSPKVAFVNAYPFRMKMSDEDGNAITPDKIASPDAQPLLGESFGFQTQLVPAGMEDELDRDSIEVYMSWYSGEEPWGYENWKDSPDAVVGVKLARAADWSEGNLVYRSAKSDMAAFVPPQLAGSHGYQIVQFHLSAKYNNKNGIEQDPHELSANDWVLPGWYRGIDDPNRQGVFCAYTVLDTISPKRAWINEINVFDGDVYDWVHQYLEVAVPQGFDMTGWSLNYIANDSTYQLNALADFGSEIVKVKTKDATNSYAFIAVQSPRTKAAGSYPGLDDGVWRATAFEGGVEDVSAPYALRLQRPTGIIEHEVVFMATNTADGRSWYTYEGTNFLKTLQRELPDSDWVYAGADAYSGSLGVYTNHGESTSCWTNTMRQTPGKVNLMANGTPQFIDPDYFDPPGGTNLWIYAYIDGGSIRNNSLKMVFGNVTNTSHVLIVPADPDTGTFSTSIVYVVTKWFEMDSVVTNEYGKSGGQVAGVSGNKRIWTLDLNNLKMSDSNSRKFEVTAFARNSSNIPDADHGGISPTDPYYPAVIDWLQNFDEKPIHLAPFWTLGDVQTKRKDGTDCILNLKEMYWFNIPPVTDSDTDEWVLKGGMGSGAIPTLATNVVANGLVTNIRVAVTMMITNRVKNIAYPPDMLRGLAPGATSYDYDDNVSSWTSVTFKVTGAIQIPGYEKIFRPLRWFTFGPDSFTNGFTRVVEVKDPFSKGSQGYAYEWYKHPGSQILYRWRVDDDETNRPPVTVYQLNDDNALLSPTE